MNAHAENLWAGQGAVLLDIGGDVGALVVAVPTSMVGQEVEIERDAEPRVAHEHADGHGHRPHVAVVARPVEGGNLPSLVFPELVEGRYALFDKGCSRAQLVVDVRGGEVTTAHWPQ
jgi:hypothetical protein